MLPRRAGRTPVRLAREWPSLLAGSLAVVLLVTMAWETGGYFPAGHLPAGAVAFACLAVLAIARPPRWTPSSPALWALASLAGLAAWTGLSSRWSGAPHTALEDMQRDLVYLSLLALGLLAAGRGRFSKHLLWGVLLVVTIVVGAGLLSRLRPDLLGYDGPPSAFLPYRLSYPLSYWNAFGALGAMGLVVSLGLAGDPRAHPGLRGLAASLAVGLGAAAYLSFSRGAWLALIAGLLVLAAVSTRRWSLLATIGVVAPILVLAVLRVDALDALTRDPQIRPGQADQGRDYLPFLLALMGAAGLAQAAVAAAGSAMPSATLRRRVVRPLAVAALVAAVIGGGIVYSQRGGDIEGRTTSEVERVEGFFERQWQDFLRPSEFNVVGSERLTTARGSRSDLYRVAFDQFEDRPLVGEGSGSFEHRFARDRKVAEKARDAHSLAFETLGELGAVGAVLLLGFVGALVAGIRRARRRRDALTGPQVAAVAAGCTVWLGHAAVDWAWQMPVVTGTALLLAAAALTGDRPEAGRGSGGRHGIAAR